MDLKLVRSIINSSEEVLKDLESSDEWKYFEKDKEFHSLSCIIIDGISKSFTDLLSYKVSQEAYQRYHVRMNLIETLREWTRFQGTFCTLRTFVDHERTSLFVIQILKRYLNNEFLRNVDSVNDLVRLASALLCIIPKDSTLNILLCRIIERMVQIQQSEQSEQFLQYITRQLRSQLRLSTVENVYSAQSDKFVKEPLKKSFEKFWNNESPFDDVDSLFEILAKSSTIFLSASTIITNEIVITGNFAPAVTNFVQLFLKRVQTFCKKLSKDIIDLYPQHLRSCAILLRIAPELHSDNSKTCAMEMWKNIFLNSQDESMILLSHYSDWRTIFTEFHAKL